LQNSRKQKFIFIKNLIARKNCTKKLVQLNCGNKNGGKNAPSSCLFEKCGKPRIELLSFIYKKRELKD
jgi:hypothetical protein